MHSSAHVLTLVAAASSAAATFQGFNYDAKVGGRGKLQKEWENEFKVAAGLEGTNGAYTSARIFTGVQVGTTDQPIEAIPAAIETKTTLLLGVWCSGADGGKASVANEIKALKNAAKQYCGKGLEETVVGISVGSEDLYRNSFMGKQNGPDPGLDVTALIDYVGQVRKAVKGTCLEKTPIGHVDTWNAYSEPENKGIVDVLDWIGADEYPYFEYQKSNSIENGKALFDAAIKKIENVAGGKPIWITESGWPVSGKTSGEAVASVENAETYYREVACPLFGKMNVWWYTLQDGTPSKSENPIFGVLGGNLQTKPLYSLSCDNATQSSKPSSHHGTPTQTATASSGSSSDTDKGSNLEAGSDSGSNAGSNTGSGSGYGSRAPGAGGAGNHIGGAVVNSTAVGSARPTGGLMPGSGSQPGSQPGGQPGGAASPSDVARAGGSQLNSPMAVTIAFLLAVAIL